MTLGPPEVPTPPRAAGLTSRCCPGGPGPNWALAGAFRAAHLHGRDRGQLASQPALSKAMSQSLALPGAPIRPDRSPVSQLHGDGSRCPNEAMASLGTWWQTLRHKQDPGHSLVATRHLTACIFAPTMVGCLHPELRVPSPVSVCCVSSVDSTRWQPGNRGVLLSRTGQSLPLRPRRTPSSEFGVKCAASAQGPHRSEPTGAGARPARHALQVPGGFCVEPGHQPLNGNW